MRRKSKFSAEEKISAVIVNELENERITKEIENIHKESPDEGYGRIRDDREKS